MSNHSLLLFYICINYRQLVTYNTEGLRTQLYHMDGSNGTARRGGRYTEAKLSVWTQHKVEFSTSPSFLKHGTWLSLTMSPHLQHLSVTLHCVHVHLFFIPYFDNKIHSVALITILIKIIIANQIQITFICIISCIWWSIKNIPLTLSIILDIHQHCP
jgi:hypothetical protein